MKRKLTFVTFGLVLALMFVSGAVAQESSQRATAVPKDRIPVTIMQSGKAIPVESLPPEARAQLDRVKAAAQRLVDQSDASGERLVVTIKCSWQPLNCTITIQF